MLVINILHFTIISTIVQYISPQLDGAGLTIKLWDYQIFFVASTKQFSVLAMGTK